MARHLTKSKVAPRWRATSDRGLDARLALIGASAALFGSVIGAGSSMVIAHLGFQHDVDQSNRSKAESAYIEYASATDSWFRAIETMPANARAEDPAPSAQSEYREASTDALARVTVYGDPKVMSRAQDLQVALLLVLDRAYGHRRALLDYVETTPPQGEELAASKASQVAQGEYLEIRAEYLLTIRSDLEVD